jgi:ADP-ribosyl-[dinitrogen reductase] hydrolase
MTVQDDIDILHVATEAAIIAGDILRVDFLQPGGPRGEGEHADADDEAEAVIRARLAAGNAPPDFALNQGWVLVALQNAFYVALHTSSFEEGVVTTVMGGGDTDTNAAIAGALLGAIHGAPAVPRQWREVVLTCRPQAEVAGVRRPRPRAFWPVDALVLSERLVALGRKRA